MANLHGPVLTDDELATFHEQGYVRLGKVAQDEEVDALCQRIDDIMLGKIRYDNMLMQLCPSAGHPELSKQTKAFKGSSLKYRKIQDLDQDPLFLPYIRHPLFRDITQKIIGEGGLRFSDDVLQQTSRARGCHQLASGRCWRLGVEYPTKGNNLDGTGSDECR